MHFNKSVYTGHVTWQVKHTYNYIRVHAEYKYLKRGQGAEEKLLTITWNFTCTSALQSYSILTSLLSQAKKIKM